MRVMHHACGYDKGFARFDGARWLAIDQQINFTLAHIADFIARMGVTASAGAGRNFYLGNYGFAAGDGDIGLAHKRAAQAAGRSRLGHSRIADQHEGAGAQQGRECQARRHGGPCQIGGRSTVFTDLHWLRHACLPCLRARFSEPLNRN